MLVLDDTIAAIATASQPALRGIIRVSGPALIETLTPVVSLEDGSLTAIDRPSVWSCQVRLDSHARQLPGRLYLWPGQRSYTRQPTAEIHTIGSPPLLQLVLRRVCAAGARLAQPGEFTLRAFLGGRIDLAKAEAVLGAIDARDEREFQVALQQMAGGLSGPINRLRDELINLCADLEAGLDFVEEDIQFVSSAELGARLGSLQAQLEGLTTRIAARRLESAAPRVVICGAPNAGKSTLFNALTQHAQAITSPEPGTTRDFLTASIQIEGQTVELIDTAGVAEESVSSIDTLAQQRARQLIHDAQGVVVCLDRSRPLPALDSELLQCTPTRGCVLVATKCDQPAHGSMHALRSGQGVELIETSGLTGQGIDRLLARLGEQLASATPIDLVGSTATRSAESLRRTGESLDRARVLATSGESEELVAAELRTALEYLGLIVGAIYTDDLLDRVFSRFCIGK